MKSKTLRTLIGGSVAAVMALSISLPIPAGAAASDSATVVTTTSFAKFMQYFSQYGYQIQPVQTVVVPKTTTVPGTVTATKPTPTAKPVATAKPTAVTAPAATATPAAPVAAVSTKATFSKQIVALVNKERAAAGLSPVSGLDSLHKVASAKATDMRANNYFSHTSPTYGSPFDMMAAFGVTYRAAGENIAMGQKTPEAVMTAWMNSPGHRANILNANFNYIGVGFDNYYWVQEFIGK